MTPTSALPTDRHWASVPTDQLADVVVGLANDYWLRLNSSGLLDIWQRSERTYYGLDDSGQWKESVAVRFGGDNDQLCDVRIGHYRSIGQAILAMAGQERPKFTAKAVNNEFKSLIEAPVATGVIDAFWKDWSLEEKTRMMDEAGLLYGLGFIHLRWSPHAGKPVMEEMAAQPGMQPKKVQKKDKNGGPMYEGDVAASFASPWRVVHDLRKAGEPLEWCLVAETENIWNLAACYPQKAEQLIAERTGGTWPQDVWGETWKPSEDPNDATVWTVYCKPCPAVPTGRFARVCGRVVLADGPAFLHDDIPVIGFAPARQQGKGFGFTSLWDLLALQDMYDSAQSALVTGHNTFGIANLYAPMESGISEEDVGSGARFVEYEPRPELPGGGKPEAVSFLAIPSQGYEWPKSIQQTMETISGVNSVARGEPNSNLKSGAALALVQSLATAFNSAFQAFRIIARERVADIGFKIVKANTVGSRMAQVAGSGANTYMREVSKDELESVDRVEIETGSPLLGTAAGRLEIANTLLEKIPGLQPQQYIQVLETGRLDPLTKAIQMQLDTVAAENDLLLDGKLPRGTEPAPKPPMPGVPPAPPEEPTVFVGQDHATHVREHQALLSSDTDPKIVALIELHCRHHYEVWSNMPPDLAALTGQTVPPPAPPMAPPPPGGDAGPPPPKGGGKGDSPAPGRAEPMGGAPSGDMPMMPKNPLTGARAPA